METNKTEQQTLTVEQREALEYKQVKDRFRETIKSINTLQGIYKSNRRTVRFPSDITRELAPNLAQASHATNREYLRHIYLAYGFFRGRKVEDVETAAVLTNLEYDRVVLKGGAPYDLIQKDETGEITMYVVRKHINKDMIDQILSAHGADSTKVVYPGTKGS